jgi:molybdate-binding protein
MEKNGALSVSILDKHILKEHGLIALNLIVGSLGHMVNRATIGNLSNMGTMGNIMGSKKLPIDVAKFHFNTKDGLITNVLILIMLLRGVILIRTILKHGAIVKTKVETM